MSELSETPGGGGGYHYRPGDSFSGGSYGSPDQPGHGYDGRDFRYASLARMSSGTGADPAFRYSEEGGGVCF